MIVCNRCNVPKDEINFRPKRKHCKKCEYEMHTQWGRNNVTKVMIQSAKFRAKRDQVPFAITVEDVVIPEVCPVFGVVMKQGSRREHENSPTIDRIIPERGYVKGNIRVISHLANMLKSKATLEQLQKMILYLETHVV